MPVVLTCHACQAKLRVAEDSTAAKVRCPTCGGAVPVPGALRAASAPPPPAPRARPAPPPAEVRHPAPASPPVRTRDCPYCGEEVLSHAKKCKHCGEVIDPTLREGRAAGRAPDRA